MRFVFPALLTAIGLSVLLVVSGLFLDEYQRTKKFSRVFIEIGVGILALALPLVPLALGVWGLVLEFSR